jgi:uroporphyrinogen-III decarboxylase
MTSRERILCALRGEKPDRVPVTISRKLIDDEAWFARDRSYSELLSIAKRKTDIIYKKEDFGSLSYRYDYPKFNPEMTVEINHGDMGVSEFIIETRKGPLKRVKKPVPGTVLNPNVENYIKDKDDVIKLMSIPYDPEFGNKGLIKEVNDIGEKGCVLLTMGDPVGSVYDLCEPEQFSVWSVTEKSMLMGLVEAMFERIEFELRAALELASKNDLKSLVFYFHGPESVIPPLQPPSFFHEFVSPYDKKLINLVKSSGYSVVMHCHGKINTFLESFINMGVDAVHPAEPPPGGDVLLGDVRQRLNNKICIIGNIQYETLSSCSEEEIERAVKAAIRSGGADGAFILSPCCGLYESPLPQKTAANYIRFIRAGLKYGKY